MLMPFVPSSRVLAKSKKGAARRVLKKTLSSIVNHMWHFFGSWNMKISIGAGFWDGFIKGFGFTQITNPGLVGYVLISYRILAF